MMVLPAAHNEVNLMCKSNVNAYVSVIVKALLCSGMLLRILHDVEPRDID